MIDWSDFYSVTKDRSHWPIVERAEALAWNKGRALDLGCGAGRDTRFLLAQGWHVTAVDREASSMAILAEMPQEKLRAVQSSIEDFDFQPESYDLISAQFSLPFITRSRFDGAFARLKGALKPGGVFAGQFFGVNDTWNTPEYDMTFVTREEIDALLLGMTVHELQEVEDDGTTALGEPKHWHVYHILAQRPEA